MTCMPTLKLKIPWTPDIYNSSRPFLGYYDHISVYMFHIKK